MNATPTTFRALGLLLSYPTRELLEALPDIKLLLRGERSLSRGAQDALAALVTWLEQEELLSLQEHYSALFDGGRFLSLHLFEHVHGDSKSRGQALVDLTALYAKEGLAVSTSELPDYLPLICEFLSVARSDASRALLTDTAPVLALLRDGLAERRSLYHAVLGVLVELATPATNTTPDAVTSEPAAHQDASLDADARLVPRLLPADLDALDREWEEAPVEFGLGAALESSCKKPEPLVRLRTNRSEAGELKL